MKSFRVILVLLMLASQVGGRVFAAPEPEVSHSLRGVADATVEQGEPLRIAVRVRAPRGAKESITLAPASGSWSDAMAIELVPAGGGAPVARAVILGQPNSSGAKLDTSHVAGGLWRFSAEAMQRVAPGAYLVRVRLVIRNGSGWSGEVASDETSLQIVPASDSPERAAQRAVNFAQDALLDGRTEAAATILATLLTRTPDDGRALTAWAEVALRAGNPAAALICLNRAAPKTIGDQPLIEREALLKRAIAAIRTTTPVASPPQWSWPPVSVMEPTPEQKALLENAIAAKPTGNAVAPPPPLSSPVTPAAAPVAPPLPEVSPVVAALAPSLPSAAPVKSVSSAIAVVVPASEFNDATVSAELSGQWATGATAGSQYGRTQYSAMKATGAPNISVPGNSPDAWCPAGKNSGTDWIELSFAKPVHATEVRVRQNDTVGAIVKLEVIEPDGTAHVWWEGADPYVAPTVRTIAWFGVRGPRTEYSVAKVKLTLNLAALPGWKQIDAVQLVGTSGH